MTTDDSTLTRAVNYALAELERVGDFEELPLPLRTFMRVYFPQGIIDNGGLQYFFENDWEGQPPYSEFVDAYCEVGAAEEARALADAVALFPFANPHMHQHRRDEFLSQFQDGGGHRPDSPFEPYTDTMCGSEEVWRCLEEYVKRHAHVFFPPEP